MFDLTTFSKFDSIIADCSKLIDQHDQISYKSEKLTTREVKPRNVSTTDPISKEIVAFCESYLTRLFQVEELKKVVSNTDYNFTDLQIHINKSSDSIVEILSALTVVHNKLSDHQIALVDRLSETVAEFSKYIKSAITSNSNVVDIINTIYTCMSHEEKQFLRVGIEIMKSLPITDDIKTHVRSKNEQLKQQVLGMERVQVLTNNPMQMFGITPDEGLNKPLSECIEQLFGIKLEQKGNDLDQTMASVMKSLKLRGEPNTGLFVFVSKNQDTYFDMTSLNLGAPPPNAGVTTKMIKTYDIIKTGSTPSAKKEELLQFNITNDTKTAFALWTNDMKMFKSRARPIESRIIQKIARQTPSVIIENYNKILSEIITNSDRNGDAISFNNVKNMSFNETTTEQSFMELLQHKLQSTIEKHLKGASGEKFHKKIAADDFEEVVLTTIDGAKADMGVLPSLLSAHCHIIYAMMAEGILAGIRKELYKHDSADSDLLKSILHMQIATDDNIFSRVISCHYLHIS